VEGEVGEGVENWEGLSR